MIDIRDVTCPECAAKIGKECGTHHEKGPWNHRERAKNAMIEAFVAQVKLKGENINELEEEITKITRVGEKLAETALDHSSSDTSLNSTKELKRNNMNNDER